MVNCNCIEFNLNTESHLNSPVGAGLLQHGQALALCLPYILADEMTELNVYRTSKNIVGLTDGKDNYKIVCGHGGKFDVNPSKTKGVGRDHITVSNLTDHLKEDFSSLMLVDITKPKDLRITILPLSSKRISPNGKVDLTLPLESQ